jgi:glutamate---cysteine ligase / carboxylate-amine ligase
MAVREHRFGAARPWTLGIEEELVLVDAETFETAPVFSRVFGGEVGPFKPELFECLVEPATGVLEADAVLGELVRLRAGAAALCEPHGVRIHAAGTHALAVGAGQPIVPVERYRRLVETIGPPIFRQPVCGLHVHVSMPDPETCLRVFEGVVPWLPVLLALSANSPFAEGVDTGRRSERAARLLEMPTGGTTGRRRPRLTPRVGTGTRGRDPSSERSRCASWTCRPTYAAPPGSSRSCRRWRRR